MGSAKTIRHADPSLLSVLRTCVMLALVVLGLFARPGPAMAEEEYVLESLTEDRMQMYLAALPELRDLDDAEWPVSDPDRIEYWLAMAEILEATGFEDYEDFAALTATVTILTMGMDPFTLEFIEPRMVLEDSIGFLQQTIAEARADPAVIATMDGAEVDPPVLFPLLSMLAELEAGRAFLPDKTSPGNVVLIKKHYPEIVRLSNPRVE